MTRWEVLLPNSCFSERLQLHSGGQKADPGSDGSNARPWWLHEGQQPGHPGFVLWQQQKALNTAPDGSEEREEALEAELRQQEGGMLCAVLSPLRLELSYAGGWEQARRWEHIHG